MNVWRRGVSPAIDLLDFLRASRNSDGGWPYYAGKSSRLEPTAWALLAFHAAGERVSADVLENWPRVDGLFVDGSSREINLGFNGLVSFALTALGSRHSVTASLRTALERRKGIKLPQVESNRQDNSLQGWSWVPETFSWVEPTALCLLALKRLVAGPNFSSAAQGGAVGPNFSSASQDGRNVSPDTVSRIHEAERLLIDRVCVNGGWNYGNANVLGRNLEPHTPPTALALLALGDRRGEEAVRRSLQYLFTRRLEERSGMALGLTRIALGIFAQPADDVASALAGEWQRSRFLDNLHVAALAACALFGAASGYEVFRV